MTVGNGTTGAFMSASSGVTGGPNLATPQPGERATFTGGTQFVLVDMGGPSTVTQLALLYTNLLANESVMFKGANQANFSDEVILGTVTMADAQYADPGYRHALLHLAASATYRYYGVFVLGVAAGQTRSAGVLVLTNALQVEYNADYGDTSWGYEEAPDPDTLDSGVTILEELPAAPYFEFSISWASEAEMEGSWNRYIAPTQWKRRPCLVVRRPDLANNPHRHTGIFWGILRLQPFVASEFDLYEVRGKIRSMV